LNIAEEHPDLYSHAESQLRRLDEVRLQAAGATSYGVHGEYERRANRLSDALKGALSLEQMELHAPALALLRVALEHHVFDLLLFGASKFRQTISGVSREVWEKWRAQIDAGESGTEDIEDAEWKGGTALVVRTGIRVVNQDGQTEYTISPYYRQYSLHDPFVGTVSEQARLAGHFTPLGVHERFARTNEELRSGWLGWEHLKDNLLLNGQATERWLQQIQVHYRFLGAYVHSTSEAAEKLIENGQSWSSRSRNPHYLSELVLLYIIAIASRELTALLELSARPPQANVGAADAIRSEIERAAATTSYFWFPGGVPHEFDRIQEANHRGIRYSPDGEIETYRVPHEEREPNSIPEDEVPYYRNPFLRLCAMHQDAHELTGFAYVSPLSCRDLR